MKSKAGKKPEKRKKNKYVKARLHSVKWSPALSTDRLIVSQRGHDLIVLSLSSYSNKSGNILYMSYHCILK